MAEFDYLGAKQAGASDEEIQSFLKANGTDFDLIGAKQAGATDDEISTFLKSQPVKKKEVSKPTTQVSSNGTTKTSQSSYNLDLSLPKVNPNPNNKALPGLGQPFKPQINLDFTKDRQKQIIAEKAVTPDYSDYNTVIQQGIKGQNRFDNTMNPLSKPIVEQQAKKEVQQLKKQQEYGNNIITKIPELKNAKNTDEAISAIIKSNRKDDFDYWQKFDDEALLGNDENTLNDFLVSNGLKNQDRELYLKEQASSNPKYGYEYEYNKIGSLFKAVKQRADDYDTVLKQKFGDNYMEIAKQGNSDILNDQDFNKFRQLREKQNELSTKANGLINDSRYSEVKSSREKVEKAQQGVDERAKNDKVYKVGDELNYIGNKLAYGAGHIVKMIAEIPSLATSFDKGYDWTDRVADWGERFSNKLVDAIPESTDVKAGGINSVAKVNGNKVIVDKEGNPIDVRDENNFKVDNATYQIVTDEYNSDRKKYNINTEFNPRSIINNGLNTMIDMGIMILGTKGAGMVGAGEKLQKLTSMGIAYQQTKRDVFNDAIKKGLDPRNADLLSNIIGVAAGTSSMLNPMEFNIAKGAGLFNLLKTDGLNAAKLALIKDGKLSVKDYAKEFVSGAIKNTIGENIEELGIESTTQAIANNHFNNQISETDMVDSGLDDRLHILDKQGLETFLITAGSSFLMTPIEINSQTQFNQQEAMKMAIENPEDFAKIKELQLKQGQISQQQFDNETKIYNDVSKTYNAVKDDVKEELQPQLLALLTKKSNLSNKISEIKDEVLSKPYKDQLEQVNKGIESISVGKNADKSLVAPIEQSEILAESTAKDGSSTITKVETAIANKINKGQELTSEETDYYNAKKDSIDKLVTVNKSPIVPINETVEVEKKEIVLPPPTPQVVAPAELDEQQITEQLNEVLNDKVTPTELIDKGQEQNNSQGLQSELENNKGNEQGVGIGQNMSNQVEVPQIEQEQEEITPTTETTPNIEAKKADIERRRQEDLNVPDRTNILNAAVVAQDAFQNETLEQLQKRLQEEIEHINLLVKKLKEKGIPDEKIIKQIKDYISNGNRVISRREGVSDFATYLVKNNTQITSQEQINAKYDAELKALEQSLKETTKAENKTLSSKTEEITPQKAIEVDRNVDRIAILEEIKSKNLTHVRGKNMGENQSLGTFISTEKGNRYETADNKAESVEVDIKNPLVVENDLGLVGKRTEILNNNKDQFTKEDTVDYQELPNGKITLDDLNDAGIKKLAKLTTEKLQADGYDGIYFKESKTQEGELVVFDKEKVKFKEQTPIADETPKLKAKEKQDLVKSLNKEQVKEFIKLKTPQEKEAYLINKRDKEQKLKNDKHDRLVSLMREYNSTPSNRTTRKQEIRQSMLKLSSDLGYSIKAKEGDRLEVLNNNGKLIRKINIPTDEKPAAAENIEKVKELTHWFNWNGNDLDFHIDAVKLGLTWQNIRTALADINAGKTESTNINRVANAINEYGNMESLPLVRGFGGNYERLDVTGDDLFWAQKVNETTELLSGYEYNEAEREQALKDLSETDEKEFEQYSDLYSKFANQDGTLNWEEALKYEQANKTTTDESAKGQGSSNDIGDGKNSQQLQKEKRSAAEIKSELKIKEAELKKLEEKQSQLNKQLEQNLKENQLDLLQGAKPQAMFDDKVEQQKIAEKSKLDIESKRKEISKLNDELDNINQEEIPFQSTDKKFTPISQSKFNQLLDKLKKAFPNVKVELFGKNDFDNARKELEKRGIVVTDTRTKDGTIYGFKTPDGKVFLNSDAINANTPIHEFGHIWQSVFPNEFAKGISLLVQSPQGRELINEIRKNPAYKGKSITEIQAEALVTAIGNKGETIFNSNPTLYNKFKQWLNDLFAKIGDKLGIKNLSPDDKFDMFTKKVVGELLGGKVLDSKVGTEKSTEKTITFQGQNIKVKEINGGAEVVNGFYSPLEKIINETKFEKLPAKQWVDKFAKGEEAKWTGLTDWLNQQQGSVSKADIQQYLKDNRIQVVEVVKTEDGTGTNESVMNDTKFSQYQLEGEKGNYKEVLVTMPVVSESAKNVSEKYWEAAKARDEYKKQNAPRKQGEDIVAYIDRANAELNNDAKYQELTKNAEVLNKKMDDANKNQGEKFKSSHFDEANILVHLRMNTRTDAEGNKVLFLEEVQSDWGQKGKKEGFVPEKLTTDKNFIDYRTELYNKYKVEKLVDLRKVAKQDELATLETLFANENDTKNPSIPTAPFVTDTNSWTKLGLKVALKEAVKQGAEKIAWTTGEQQNDRYDLQKQVDFIDVFTNDDGTYHIVAVKGNNTISEEKSLKENQLEGLLGKDLTNKIIEDTKNHTHREGEENLVKTYRGKDLSVGGKGMKGFYGSPTEGSLGIVGNVAKSLFKQEPKTVEISNGVKGAPVDLYKWVRENHPEINLDSYDKKEIDKNERLISKGSAIYKEYENEKNTFSTQHSIGITPEMKAMVELGQPLFQFKPDELTKKVQELRDFELTDSEIRDYLLEAGNTKQQIDDALGVKEVEENKDETKKELSDSKQRVAERIVLGNSTLNAVKEHIVQQGYDKSDYDSKQIFKDVDELINKFGIEKAESFIDKIGDVGLSEPHKVVLQHKIAEYYGNKALSDETLTEEERKDAMFKSAQLFLDLSEQRTDAGRGNAILAQIYLDSDIYFTLPMFENKMNAIGAQLSGAEKIELENLQNEIKELRKENTKLQELAKKEAEQQIVDDITTHLLVDDLIIDSKIKDDLEVKNAKSILAKGFEDIARMLSSIAMAQQVDKVKFKDTILDMTKATMTISKIGVKKALKSVIKAIKNANQNIDEKLLEDAEKHVLSKIKDTDTGIKKKNKEGISKDELIELIEQGADTMEKMVEAIRDKYYDGDKSISDKQIRDEITNYGNSIRQSQTQVEEKLSEIKSLMLLQSKLEDAENNVAPKKTGFIRDKDKIAVREKRRELAEAMKKLTVTLSEDDIAGLNERKLTQIANKIEEVQKVLDGYEKIKNKANFDYNDAVKKKQQELDDLMSSQKALLHYAKENLTNLVAKYQDKLDKKQYSKNPTLNKLSITDSEYQKLKNQLEAKKEQLKSERDNFRNNNADYLLENRQKQIDRQIVEIDNLLAGIKVRKTSEQIKAEKDRKAGVINSSTNQTALDKLKENQQKLEAKKEQWERKVIQKEVEIEKAKQTWLQKIGINVQSISRTLTLGFTDIGWLGVQGGYFGRTKPHLFAKALKESFKGKLSEDAFNQWKRDLKSNPFYETMIKAGLRIPSQSLRDDIFEQEFRESGFTKLLGKNEVTDIVNKNGRLSVKFLANLRIQVFQKMYNGLTDSQKADKEVLEKLADYVNSRSGAGQVIGEDNKRGLNKWWGLLTSARNTSAMLQQTYIGMLYGLAKNYVRNKPLSNQPIIARQLVNDLLNQAVLFSGLYLSYLIANGLSGDDDEWNVETSPFSTNFLKLKNKEGDRSYFDMGGMTALNVATLRLLTTITNAFGTDFDNFKDYKGEYSKVGLKDYSSKTGLQILSESIFNRTLSLLAPIKNPFTAKSDKDGNYSMYGKTYTPTEFKLKMLMDMFIPMNLPNIYNDITDKDVNALNAIVNTVLNVIGVSNQNQKYDRPEDSTSPQVNSVPVKSTPVSSMPIVPIPVK